MAEERFKERVAELVEQRAKELVEQRRANGSTEGPERGLK